MGELLDTRQAALKTMQSESKALKSQTSLDSVWDLLMPAQKEAAFQTVVQICHQLMRAQRGDGKEQRNE